jgi:hypothetical protein
MNTAGNSKCPKSGIQEPGVRIQENRRTKYFLSPEFWPLDPIFSLSPFSIPHFEVDFSGWGYL